MTVNYYRILLDLPEDTTSPDHYTLLGVDRFCRDTPTIEAAAAKRLDRLDQQILTHDENKHDACLEIIDRVASARTTLIDVIKRDRYEQKLAGELNLEPPEPPRTPAQAIDQIEEHEEREPPGPVAAPAKSESGAHALIGFGVAAAVAALLGVAAVISEVNQPPIATHPKTPIPNTPYATPGPSPQPNAPPASDPRAPLTDAQKTTLATKLGSENYRLDIDGRLLSLNLSDYPGDGWPAYLLPTLTHLQISYFQFEKFEDPAWLLHRLPALSELNVTHTPLNQTQRHRLHAIRPDLNLNPLLSWKDRATPEARVKKFKAVFGLEAVDVDAQSNIVRIDLSQHGTLSPTDWQLLRFLPDLHTLKASASQLQKNGTLYISGLARLNPLQNIEYKEDVPVLDQTYSALLSAKPNLRFSPEPIAIRFLNAKKRFEQAPGDLDNSRFLMQTHLNHKRYEKAVDTARHFQTTVDPTTIAQQSHARQEAYWYAMNTRFVSLHAQWKNRTAVHGIKDAQAAALSKRILTLRHETLKTHGHLGPLPWRVAIQAIAVVHVPKKHEIPKPTPEINPTRTLLGGLVTSGKTQDAETMAIQYLTMLEPKLKKKTATDTEIDSYFYALLVRMRIWDGRIEDARRTADTAIARAIIDQEANKLKAYLGVRYTQHEGFGPEDIADDLAKLFEKHGGKITARNKPTPTPPEPKDPPAPARPVKAATQIKTLKLLDTGEAFQQLQMGGNVMTLQFEREGKHAVKSWNVLDLDQNTKRYFATPLSDKIDIVAGPTMKQFMVNDVEQRSISFHDLASGRMVDREHLNGDVVFTDKPFFSDNGARAFWFEGDQFVSYEVARKRVKRRFTLKGFTRGGNPLLGSSYNGRLLAYAENAITPTPGGTPALVRVYDTSTGKIVRNILLEHGSRTKGLGFSHDGKLLVTANMRENRMRPPARPFTLCELSIWNLVTGKEVVNKRLPYIEVNTADISPDGKRVVIQATDKREVKTLRLLDIKTGTELAKFGGGMMLGFSTDAARVAIYSPAPTKKASPTVQLWQLP